MHQRHNHNLFFRALFLCLLLAFSIPALAAETVKFKLRSGDTVSGIILTENTNLVVISNAWTKELSIPLAEIQSRELILPKTAAVTNATVVAVTNSPAPATTNAPVVAKKPAPVVAKKTEVKAKKPSDWHGDIAVGADIGISEKERQLYYARLKVTYAPVAESGPNAVSRLIDRFRNTFQYNAAYGTTDGILSANRMDGSSKTDFDLGEDRKIFVYNLFAGSYDEIRRIEHRYEIGPGVGYHLINRTNLILNVEAGMNYQTQYVWSQPKKLGPRFYTSSDRVYYRFAEDFTWKFSKLVTFDEKFEFFPLHNFEQYRFRFESNLRYWLLENLSVNLTVIDIYDTLPAKNVGRNDLQVRSSIGVKF